MTFICTNLARRSCGAAPPRLRRLPFPPQVWLPSSRPQIHHCSDSTAWLGWIMQQQPQQPPDILSLNSRYLHLFCGQLLLQAAPPRLRRLPLPPQVEWSSTRPPSRSAPFPSRLRPSDAGFSCSIAACVVLLLCDTGPQCYDCTATVA